MDYAGVKLVHQASVALSLTGFLVRACASLAGAGWVHGRWAKTLPHVIDTALLVSALTLIAMLPGGSAHAPWVWAKVVGLLLYVALGIVALRCGLPRPLRAAAAVAALGSAGWIVSVAMSKSAWGYFSPLTV